MNRKLLTILGVTALSVAAVAVYAAGAGRDHGPRGGGEGPPEMGFAPPGMMAPFMLHRLADELNLSEDQRNTIKGLLESARPNMQALRKEARDSTELLQKTQPDDPNYSSVVAQASQKAGELASRLVTDGSQLRSQVWQVLTPDQRKQFQELQAKLHDRMHERMKERRMHRRPPTPEAAPAAMNDGEKRDTGLYPPAAELPMMVVSATRIRV